MCMAKIGEVVKINKKEALVKFGNKTSKINISLLKNVKIKDKVVCSGKIAIERIGDED